MQRKPQVRLAMLCLIFAVLVSFVAAVPSTFAICSSADCHGGCVSLFPPSVGDCFSLDDGRSVKLTCGSDDATDNATMTLFSDETCGEASIVAIGRSTNGQCGVAGDLSFKGSCASCDRHEPFYAFPVNRDTFWTPPFIRAPAGELFEAPPGSVLAVSLWIRLAAAQESDLPCIISLVADDFNSGFTNNSMQLRWNNREGHLEVHVTSSQGSRNLVAAGTGLVDITSDHWRLVTVVLDSARGSLKIYANAVLEFAASFPALAAEGFTLRESPHAALRLGCLASGVDCINGQLGDLLVQHVDPTRENLRYIFSFRAWADESCAVADHSYPRGTKVFRFGPGRSFSMPGSSISFGSSVIGRINHVSRMALYPTVADRSWTSEQHSSGSCGAVQEGSIEVPANNTNWEVAFGVSVATTAPPSAYPVITFRTPEGLLLGTMTVDISSPHQRAWIHVFVTKGLLRFVAEGSLSEQPFGDWCIQTVAVLQKPATSIDTGDHVLTGAAFETTPTTVTVYDGIPPTASVAIRRRPASIMGIIDCSTTAVDDLITLTPVMHDDGEGGSVINFYTFTTPALDKGVYSICLYPGSTIPDAQMMFARSANDHLTTIMVVEIPGVASPLQGGWITSLLHLGSSYYSYIPHGLMGTDYFASIGGQANLQPIPGDILHIGSQNLTWTPMTVADGVWGQVQNETEDNNWVKYFAIAIYSPSDQQVVLAVDNCESIDIWAAGTFVYQSQSCLTSIGHSAPFTLPGGWIQFIIKLHRRVGSSFMSMRFEQSHGLSWNFYIPHDRDGNPAVVNYSDICTKRDEFDGSMPCVGDGIEVAEDRCYSLGCCFDISAPSADARCYAPMTGRQTWRTDGRCGPQFPAAATNISGCNPHSSGHAVCCSPHGWCGDSTDHCTCERCINYEYEALHHARCTYSLWGTHASCGAIAQVMLPGVFSNAACRQRCDLTEGCTAYSRGSVSFSWSPATCTLYFENCEKTHADNAVSETYRAFCDKCGFHSNCSSCACPENFFNVYFGAPVSLADCQRQCELNTMCVGIDYRASDQSCRFSQQRCTSPTNTSNSGDFIASYKCEGDDASPPEPIVPQFPDDFSSDDYSFIGCFPDPQGFLLSQPSYGMNMLIGEENMTVRECYHFCGAKGTRLFSLFDGNRCSCGGRYDKRLVPTDPATQCATTCPGNASETCGGPAASKLFVIPLVQASCPDNYTYFHRWCYKYVGSDGKGWLNWTSALASCLAEGASLTSILSDSENQYLVGLPFLANDSNTRIMWSGGHDIGAGESFVWVDGWPFNYSDWRDGEPNGGGWTMQDEECIEIFSNYPTPFKGTWNDRDCAAVLPYVCKKSAAGGSPTGLPHVAAASSEGGVACADHDATPDHIEEALAGWWRLDAIRPASGPPPQLPDSSAGKHHMTFLFNESSVAPGTTQTPRFQAAKLGPGLIFNGATYLETMQHFSFGAGMISVALWLKPDRAEGTSIIMCQSVDTEVESLDFTLQFAWALTQEGGRYCFHVGGVFACTSAAAASPGAWHHVAATFDGVRIAIFVSGMQLAEKRFPAMVGIPESPMGITIGYRSALPFDPSLIYRGVVDDVRLYGAALAPSDVAYLSSCSPDERPPNVLSLFSPASAVIVLHAHAVTRATRFGLSPSGSCDGTPVLGGRALETELTFDGSETALIRLQEADTQVAGSFALCIANPVAPQLFTIPTGLRLGFVRVSRINGSDALHANTSQFPLTIDLTGENMAPSHVITFAVHPSCNILSATVELRASTNFSSSGTTIRLPTPVSPTDVLYVCWAASFSALAAGSTATGGLMTTMNAFFTGLKVLINTDVGVRMKRIATVSGSKNIDRTALTQGVFYAADNFVLPCGDGIPFGDKFFLIVSMGIFTDYLIPQAGFSVCDVLVGPPFFSSRGIYSYSAVNPLQPGYDGSMELVPTSPSKFIGGSPQLWPSDDREYLSSWGSPDGDYSGGCCHNKAGQEATWFQGYTIVVAEMPAEAIFVNVPMKATVMLPNEPLLIQAMVVDVHGAPVDIWVAYTITLAGPSGEVQRDFVGSGELRQALDIGELRDVVYSTIAVTLVIRNLTISNGATHQWDVLVRPPPRPPSVALYPDSWITTFLHFGSSSDVVPSRDSSTASAEDWFPSYGGEANLRPSLGERMTVTLSDDEYLTREWQRLSNPSGMWNFDSSTSSTFSTRFFAGALYSAGSQNIRITYSCDDGMVMFLDGRQVVSANTITFNRTTRTFQVAPGWHQVVIRFFQRDGRSLLAVRFEGTGLSWRTELPAHVPEGATPLVESETINQMLHLGGLLGSFETDFLNSESIAAPHVGRQVGDHEWTAASALGGTWTVQPAANADSGLVAEMTVHYLAAAMYGSTRVNAAFDVTFDGPCRVLWNGDVLVDAGASFTPTTRLLLLNITAGWHQLLVKLGVATIAGNTNFSMKLRRSDGDIAWGLQVRRTLPQPAQELRGNVVRMLALVDNSSIGAIPFGPATPEAAADSSDFYMREILPIETFGVVRIERDGSTTPFSWHPMRSSSGAWGQRVMGGSFNQYWSVALYATVSMPDLAVSIDARQGFALWLDGSLRHSSASYSHGGASLELPMTAGWHTLVVKLRAPEDSQLVNVPSTTSYAQANAICHARQMQLCFSDAVCPRGRARPGVFPVQASSSFVPVRDDSNVWIQVGEGTEASSTCQVEAQPSWGTGSSAISERRQVLCCGRAAAPNLEMELFPRAPHGEPLGWAYAVPPRPLVAPSITVTNPRSRSPSIQITSSDTNVVIIYTTNNTVPTAGNGITFAAPFDISDDTTIMAIAMSSSGRKSPLASYFARIPRSAALDRRFAVAHTSTWIGVYGSSPGFAVVFAPSGDTAMLRRLESSLQLASSVPVSSTYSGVLVIQTSLNVVLPPLDPGEYSPIYYASPPSVSGTGSDATGVLMDQMPVTVQAISVEPHHVFSGPAVTLTLRGGVASADSVLFLDLVLGENVASRGQCTLDRCAGAVSSHPSQPVFAAVDPHKPQQGAAFVTLDLTGFAGTLSCMCFSGTGRRNGGDPDEILVNPLVVNVAVVEAPAPSGPSTASPAPLPPNTTDAPSSGDVIVSSITPLKLASGDSLTITGTFPRASPRFTSVDFVSTLDDPSIPVPTCTVTVTTASTIVCTVRTSAGAYGHWNAVIFAASETGVRISRFFLALAPPAPIVLGAYGDCVRRSRLCSTGTVMHFTGTNFDSRNASNNRVLLYRSGVRSASVLCRIVHVLQTEIQCQLVVPEGTSGSFDVRIEIGVTESEVIDVDSRAFIVFGAGDSPGWTGQAAVDDRTPPPSTPTAAPRLSAGVIVVIVSLVLLLFAAVGTGIYTKTKYRFIDREAGGSEMVDFMDEQLLPGNDGVAEGGVRDGADTQRTNCPREDGGGSINRTEESEERPGVHVEILPPQQN